MDFFIAQEAVDAAKETTKGLKAIALGVGAVLGGGEDEAEEGCEH